MDNHSTEECTGYKSRKRKSNTRSNAIRDVPPESQAETSGGSGPTIDRLFMAYGSKGASPWIIDSGCTHHVTGDPSLIVDGYKPDDHWVSFPNGESLRVELLGKVHLTVPGVKGNDIEIVLTDVRLVPGVEWNLMSVMAWDKKGARITFKGSRVRIYPRRKAGFYGRVDKSGLYVLQPRARKDPCLASTGKAKEAILLHRRFGHISPARVTHMSNSGLFRGLKKGVGTFPGSCEDCFMGKSRKKPFGKSRKRASQVNEAVHADLVGPLEPTPGGARYALVMVDDCSRMRWAYPIKRKNDAEREIVAKYERDKTLHRRGWATFRCDNGGEFVNHRLENFFRKVGVAYTPTIPYCPQQNGMAERSNGLIQDMMRTLLLDSRLPSNFWGEAIVAACYILNRMGTRSLGGKAPYHLWYKESPNLATLRAYGSITYAHIPKEIRSSKLGPRAERGIFIGYNELVPGYKVLNLKNLTTSWVRHADFDESARISDGDLARIMARFPQQEEPLTDDPNYEPEPPKPHRGQWEAPKGQPVVEDFDESELKTMEIVHVYDDDEPGKTAAPAAKGPSHKPLHSNAIIDDGGMLRRDICNSFRGWNYSPHVHRELAMLSKQDNGTPPAEPRTYRQALRSPQVELWKKAMDEEYNSLIQNGTWKLVPLPRGRKAIGSKWVYKLKRDEHGEISRYKARLVAQGYTQIPGVDFHETSAPVAAFTTLRALLKIAVERSYLVHQMDVKTAFLNGTLNEEIYMKQPRGYEGRDPSMVCKLVKSIYGLKQAQKVWNDLFNSALRDLQFEPSEGDPCLYYRDTQQGRQFILIYVDDVVLVFNDEGSLRSTKHALQNRFTMTDMGELNWFLGMKISWAPDRSWIKLDQSQYISQVLERFEMTNCHEKGSPLPSGPPLSKEDCPQTDEHKADMASVPYREAVGCLMYAMVGTRPDLAFTVGCLSRYVANPGRKHWKALRHTLRYLKGTAEEGLILKQDALLDLHAYVDADWATDPDTRKSVSGIVIMLGSTPIYWKSQKQGLVTCSTTEAEYVALCKCLQELKWIKRVIAGMTEVRTPTTVYEDNMSCIHLATGEKVKSRSKHIDVKYHYVRDQVRAGEVEIEHMPSERMLADLLTKSLSATRTLELKKGLFVRTRGHLAQWEVDRANEVGDREHDARDHALAMRFWTRITKTEPKEAISLISEDETEGSTTPAPTREGGRRASPLNTPLRTEILRRDACNVSSAHDENSEPSALSPGLIQTGIEVRLVPQSNSNSKVMSQPNRTSLKRRAADGSIDWTPPAKRACLDEWARNRVIVGLTALDYEAFTEQKLSVAERLLRKDILDEVNAIRTMLHDDPHPAANAPVPDQICTDNTARTTHVRAYSSQVMADALTPAQKTRLPPEVFVDKYLIQMKSSNDLLSVLDTTGLLRDRNQQGTSAQPVSSSYMAYIQAGEHGLSLGEAPEEEEDNQGGGQGDQITVASMEESMGDHPIVYCGREQRQGRTLHMFGIVENDNILLTENAKLRQMLQARDATIDEMKTQIADLAPVKVALDARNIQPGDLLDWMGRVQEGDAAMRKGPSITQKQARYFQELLKGLTRQVGAEDARFLDKLQEGIEISKRMSLKDRESFANGVANTLETMAEEIIQERITKKTWTKENFIFKVPTDLLLLAISLCSKAQMGVSKRVARRLMVGLTGLVAVTKDRGLFKGRNKGSNWGFDMVLAEAYLNLSKDTATG